MRRNLSLKPYPEEQLETLSLSFRFSWLILILLCCARVCSADEGQTIIYSAETQAKVTHLLETIIQDYWNGEDSKLTGASNRLSNNTNVESAFRAASRLMPDRLDLRFGI